MAPTTEDSTSAQRDNAVQRFFARLVGAWWFWAIFVALMFSFPVLRSIGRKLPTAPLPVAVAPAFTLVDQDGRPFGTGDLRGKVWVADFLSMQDNDVSDARTKVMAKLKFRTRNVSVVFHLVSFTLDPANDDLPRRTAYADRFKAYAANWSFVGGDPKDVSNVLEGFGLTTSTTPSGGEMSLREKLVLVDKQGRIRGRYDANENALDALVGDIGLLANEP